MSRFRELLGEHCPDGVPVRALGDIGEFSRGRRFTKNDVVVEGERVPSIHYGEIYTSYGTWTENAISYVRADLRKQLRFARSGDVIIAGVGETVEDVAKAVAWMGAEQVAYHDDCFAFRHDEDPKYIAYVMQTADFHAQKNRHVARAKVKRVSSAGLAKIKIPVPPRPVQRGIVRILDTYSPLIEKLTNEIASEIHARRVQYDYYRDLALPLAARSSDIVPVPMGDVLQMKAGKFIKASLIRGWRTPEHPVPCFGGNGLRGYVATPTHQGEYLLIGRQGALSGNVKRVSGAFHATEHAVVATMGTQLNVDWAYHMLTAMNLNQYVSQGAQPGLSVTRLKKVQIRVPGLAEQAVTAAALDDLDATVQAHTASLADELRTRREQYEYYRDQLFRFEEAVR